MDETAFIMCGRNQGRSIIWNKLTQQDADYFNTLPLEDLLKFSSLAPFSFNINNGKIDSISWKKP